MSHRYKNDNIATQTVVYCLREKCGLINKTCETCAFNVEEVCTGEGNHSYGQKIKDFNKECDGWGISFDYFTEMTEKMPWYIKDAYDRGKIYFEDA